MEMRVVGNPAGVRGGGVSEDCSSGRVMSCVQTGGLWVGEGGEGGKEGRRVAPRDPLAILRCRFAPETRQGKLLLLDRLRNWRERRRGNAGAY